MAKRRSENGEMPSKKKQRLSDAEPPKESEPETITWPEEDLFELISQIEKTTPENDTFSYVKRMKHLNWDNVIFKSYTIEECQKVAHLLYKKVRHFRRVREITSDMRELLKKPSNAMHRHFSKRSRITPFQSFFNEKREQVRSENPGVLGSIIQSKVSQMYKQLPPEEIQKYKDLARQEQEAYDKKVQAFYAEHPELISPTVLKNVQVRTVEKPPERPKTPLQLYAQVEFDKEPDQNFDRFAYFRKCKQRYASLPDKDKFFWIRWSEEQFEKYRQKVKAYIREHPHYVAPLQNARLTKTELAIKERCLGKPRKPPQSSYLVFAKAMLSNKEVQGSHGRESMSYVAEAWKNCTASEKEEYKTRLETLWDEYHKQYDAYLAKLPPAERQRVRESETKPRDPKPRIRHTKGTTKCNKKGKLNVVLEKPEAPPSTAYAYFASVYKGGDPLSAWKNFSSTEKKVYLEMMNFKRESYITKYEAYLKSLGREELEKLMKKRVEGQEDKSDESGKSVAESDEDL